MTKKGRQQVLCAALFIAGIAFCIGGFFISPLLVLGATFLAGSLGVAANIYEDKDRVTVNNNYSNYTFPPESAVTNQKIAAIQEFKPENKIKSFFGFKNKKFMNHHEELERIKEHPVEEYESNSMQLPPDVIAELAKLNAMLERIDLTAMNKLAREFESKSYSHGNDNKA